MATGVRGGDGALLCAMGIIFLGSWTGFRPEYRLPAPSHSEKFTRAVRSQDHVRRMAQQNLKGLEGGVDAEKEEMKRIGGYMKGTHFNRTIVDIPMGSVEDVEGLVFVSPDDGDMLQLGEYGLYI
eukprot:1394444-Amorphochlora_amoeboformis.AAC.1